MNDLREAARLALEALERGETKLRYEAITALRAAIEQAQEPVAWAVELPDGTRKPLYTAEFTCSTGLCHYKKPLTDEQIDQVTDAQWASNNHKPIYAAHRAYARAIEAKLMEKP